MFRRAAFKGWRSFFTEPSMQLLGVFFNFPKAASRELQTFSEWGKRNPLILNATAACVLGGSGDLIAQEIEGAECMDLKRTACVCAWYAPAAVLFWTPFMGMQERLLGSSGVKSVVGKVVSYNLAVSTVDITGFNIVSLTPQVGWDKAVTTLRETYQESVLAGLGLWLPAMTIIFTFVPAHLRLATSYALDTVWASVMSFLSNRRKLLVEADSAAQPLPPTPLLAAAVASSAAVVLP